MCEYCDLVIVVIDRFFALEFKYAMYCRRVFKEFVKCVVECLK